MNIKEYIKSKRDSLGVSSINTYASLLRSIYKKVFGSEPTNATDYEKFNETDKILDAVKDEPANKRKTTLSALVIVTGKKEYREKMMEDVKEYSKQISLQQKTPAQEENWVEPEDITKVLDELKTNADMLYKKKSRTGSDMQEIQNYIIMCLLSGKYCPVRRSKDYCDFKIKSVDTEKDNYYDGKDLVFNSYKTAKAYGKQTLPVSTQLKNILKKWIAINPTDYLLFDTNMNPLTSVKLNQRLNKIFGGMKVGVNNLRHSVLTDKFGEQIKQKKDIENTMTAMGSSPAMLTTYVKS
jgi:integrase